MNISIVVPVYNGSETISLLTSRLESVLIQVTEAYEVLLVNDGSQDNSWDVIVQLSKNHSWVRGINLMRNYGQHNALLAGIRAAKHEIIVTMDDDLQHPPEELPKLFAEIEKGYDVVYGIPEVQKHSIFRTISSRFIKWLMGIALDSSNIAQSGAFRVFRAQVRDAFLDYRSQFVSIDVLLGWGTSNFNYLPVRHDPRYSGKSNYSFRKLVRHTFNMVTGFSTLPLRLASLLGFVFTIFGFLVLVYVVGRDLIQGSPVQGFPFLASIIALFSGVQLFAMGIFGEYLARMYFRLMGRPPSVTRETVGLSTDQEKNNG
jgi:undecaprenyl-phosphate 4-deoxy-4-formamido-L-arabinose transferase